MEVHLAPFLQGWLAQLSCSVQWCPDQPRGQVQVYEFNDERWQVPPFLQGLESHTLETGVSQRELVNPTGQVQVNEGAWLASWATTQVPPFWHLVSPVLQGFLYWQYSPT